MAERFTDFLGSYCTNRDIPVNTATTIGKGEIVMIDAAGNARPGALLAAGVVRTRGVAQIYVANPAGGDKRVVVSAGVHGPFENNGNSITIANEGADCFVVSASAVDLSSDTNTRGRAGRIEKVTSKGVFVLFD